MKPILINNLEFALNQELVESNLRVEQCERLLDVIATQDHSQNKINASINYELTGFKDKLHLPSLHLRVWTILPVTCQRCLNIMNIDLSFESDYVISDTAPSENEPDDIDWVETSVSMSLIEMIEDELIIAMPMGVMHESDCMEASTESGVKPNPFAVLKGRFK